MIKAVKKIFFVVAAGLLVLTGCTQIQDQGKADASKKNVMFVGASIGKAWKLAEYSQRTGDRAHSVEFIAVYQFDKTEAIDEILMRPKRKFHFTLSYIKGFFRPSPVLPNIIVIKECSSYFPGDIALQQELVQKWVKRIRDARVEVILATVVPVTRARAEAVQGKIEGILAYNDWIRDYAKKEKITLIDLEAALRKSDRERSLRDELNSGDGTHLNQKAYEILDNLLRDLLQR